MLTTPVQAIISAEDKEQADAILSALLEKKLVIGGLMLEAPAKFWWKGKIFEMKYCNILTFTLAKHKKKILSEVKRISVEEVPMIVFSPIEGNSKFLNWIETTL